MARPRNHLNHISSAVEGLVRSITALVGSLHAAVASGSGAAGGPVGRIPGQRGPGKNNPLLKAAIKASWARMTPAEREARVTKMLAGRGLKRAKGGIKRGAKGGAKGGAKK